MTSAQTDPDRAWWKEAVVYQIYPQSFNDSDGDGVGDLRGIVERLDYLEALGVDVVWLNPVYDSPHHDDGYDVRDYRAIHEAYGDLDDWERLRDGLHERGMRLVMDLVVNHTSDEHEWFVEARENPDGEHRDYYIWRPGDPDDPPNNWESAFGGSAWTYDEASGEHYLHLFDEHQPDLDWENPTVREEVYELMRWWLERGIDGFRMDVVNLISKPEGLPDGDPGADWTGVEHCTDGPRLDEFLAEMRDETFGDYDVLTVGEMPGVTLDQARRHTGVDGPLDTVFHFQHIAIDQREGWWAPPEWELTDLKEVLTRWQTGLDGGWNAVYLGNHDWPRVVSRFGDEGRYRRESAKLWATLLLTLRGTPFVFQGDELGMTNYPFDSLDEVEDAETLGYVEQAVDAGEVEGFDEIRDVVRQRSRDNARTPMQWDASEHAGFTDGDPWLPVNPNHDEVNVERERADEDSVVHYYRRLIAMRHDSDTLVYGEYELLLPDHERVFAYTRTLGDEELLVVLNVADDETSVDLPALSADADLLVCNYGDDPPATDTEGTLALRPYEARVYRR